jgi:neuronal guanine nucleotide exchange factor
VVHECNEGARKMERLEELLVLSRQLDFGAGVKALPLMSASRWLVKRGQLTRLLWKESDTMKRAGGLGKSRPHKQPLHLFLFTDVLIITKKKGY